LRCRPGCLLAGISEAFGDERMRYVGQLAHQEQVVATEAIRVAHLLFVVDVRTSERDIVEFALIGFVLPHGRFDATEAEGFDGGVLSMLRRLIRF
jgi:hypothetical protein